MVRSRRADRREGGGHHDAKAMPRWTGLPHWAGHYPVNGPADLGAVSREGEKGETQTGNVLGLGLGLVQEAQGTYQTPPGRERPQEVLPSQVHSHTPGAPVTHR